MNRDEALEILKNDTVDTSDDWCDAFEMAIKALEQEPCEDAISRQEALDCFTATKLKKFDFILYAREEIKKLPSVTPAEKVGRWIMHIDDLFPADSTMECNKCHEHQPITIDDNYCPNCGAKMQEVEDNG